MLEKNQKIKLTCTSDHLGVGTTVVESIPLHVPEWLSGEKAEILVVKVEKERAYGKLLSLQSQSKNRVTPPCEIARQCGGCELQHLSIDAQRAQKQAEVKRAFSAYPELAAAEILPVLPSTEFNYRNKAQFAVQWTHAGIDIGLYATRSIRVINTFSCAIQDPLVNRLLMWHHRFFVNKHEEFDAESWPIHHLVIRVGTEGVMVALVSSVKKISFLKEWTKKLSEAFPEASLYLNVNHTPGNNILGPESRHFAGPLTIKMTVNDVSYQVKLDTFFQSNTAQTKVLFDEMLAQAALTTEDRVVDLYCGVGAMTLQIAPYAKEVIGIESVASSIKAAKLNAEDNGITNATFMCGEAESLLNQCGLYDVVVMDPPRKGCHSDVLTQLALQHPKRIVYVSCNPETLARDLAVLVKSGYGVTKVQPVDMFPQTSHVEVVASLTRL